MSGTDHNSNSWQASASQPQIRFRARMLSRLRAFFDQREVLEVHTPVMSLAANPEPALESFSTHCEISGRSEPLKVYLNTSPEFAMKRLLASGSGDIYQVASVFRHGEMGGRHNPEFTLLEWYRTGMGYHELMQEVDSLLCHLAEASDYSLGETVFISYQQLFIDSLQCDPLHCSVDELRHAVKQAGIDISDLGEAKDPWLDLLMSHIVEPQLPKNQPVFVYDYPASQAALARVRDDVAERFELFLGGMELANGFHELWDAVEQRQRFEQQNSLRGQQGHEVLPVDENLLAALEHSEVECSGVALGLERLQMVLTGANHISDVVCFDFLRS